MAWEFYSPTKVIFGVDTLKSLGSVVKTCKVKKVFLVTGKKSMKKIGVTDMVLNDYLNGYEVCVYDKVSPNPTTRDIDRGLDFFKNEHPDILVAIGGGSSIDSAKAISILANNTGSVDAYLWNQKRIENKGLPLIAVPTTSGSGSEVTPFASIVDENKRAKRSLHHDYIYPDVAIVDPKLTVSMPKNLTAITGMDALSHAVEAYWSKWAQPITDECALKSIKLIYDNLMNAWGNPNNIEARKNMSLASLLAGRAISGTKTTICHSVSYPITVYYNVPHGLACSLTLPYFMEYNSTVVRQRVERISEAMEGRNIDEGITNLKRFIKNLNLPNRLSGLGIKESDIQIIIKNGFRPDRAGNNPRAVTEDDLRRILMRIL